MLQVEKLTLAGRSIVADDTNIASAVINDGEVYIIRDGLRVVDCFQTLVDLSLDAFHELGSKTVRKIRQQGFAELHRIITTTELLTISPRLYDLIPPVGPTLLAKIGRELLHIRDPFYVENLPNARVIFPLDATTEARVSLEAFEEANGPGKLTVHGPHHDSWFEHPLNVINIWIAISPVLRGNGMSVYPEVWPKRLPYDARGQIKRDQYYGRAINFELSPGDIAIFAGEHLHGSEINTTDKTRYVISGRLTLDEPNFFGREAYQYFRSDAVSDDIRNVPRAPWKKKPGPLRRSLGRLKRAVLGIEEKRYMGHPDTREILPLDDTSGSFPKRLEVREDDDGYSVALTALAAGEIRPLSKGYCLARTGSAVFAISRFCPHQGADLAAGYIEEDSLFCPWHNLRIELRTEMQDHNDAGVDVSIGKTTCQSLADISTRELEILDDRIQVPGLFLASEKGVSKPSEEDDKKAAAE